MDWSTPKGLVGIVVVTVVCSGLTAGILVGSGLVTTGPPTVEQPNATDGPIDSERLYAETIDSVVTVYVVGESGSSSGSGFVYDDAGHLVTNHHVIDDAETVEVKFGARGEWRRATVVGSDPRTDLAVLEIDNPPASATPLSTTNQSPQQGADAVAIGSPLRLEGTITTGTISGVDRSLRLPGGPLVPDAIQTDAAINPGNSGGPLLNAEGRVLGVNTARADGDNIGFVVSAATVDHVVPSLIETGSYTHPYLGVETRTVVPAIATANDLTETSGAVVVGVDRRGSGRRSDSRPTARRNGRWPARARGWRRDRRNQRHPDRDRPRPAAVRRPRNRAERDSGGRTDPRGRAADSHCGTRSPPVVVNQWLNAIRTTMRSASESTVGRRITARRVLVEG